MTDFQLITILFLISFSFSCSHAAPSHRDEESEADSEQEQELFERPEYVDPPVESDGTTLVSLNFVMFHREFN